MEDGIGYRRKYRGLIGINPKLPIRDTSTLSVVYTPGVAKPCLEIAKDILTSFDYTIRGNTVAIITDGSSVYGIGNAGPYAAIPMLEAKSVFHKTFAGIDGFPIAINTQDVDEFVETVCHLAPTFGAIHLEDISAPRCFAIEERLKRAVSLPLFHTDQQGAAVAVLAGLTNALKIVNKKLENTRIVINGAGAAGIATAKMLKQAGAADVKVCDLNGCLYYGRPIGMNWAKSELARLTNPEEKQATLDETLRGADVFIGFSARHTVTPEMIRTMAKDAIVFALALPEPEISYAAAKAAGARIVATGRSDCPNQINSSFVFPGIFRGALDVRATDINYAMFYAAAEAMANLVSPDELSEDKILPKAMDYRLSAKIAGAVAKTAQDTGVALNLVDAEEVENRVLRYVYEGANAWIEPAPLKSEKLTIDEESLELHKRYHGVIEVNAHLPIRDHYIYNLVYSPPNATLPCEMIRDNPQQAYDLTIKNNLVAVVTDGSAVLGLGNIGPSAGMPVMEGKAVLFKTFGGVEAFPICLGTQDPTEIVETIRRIAPVFGGINLEDISAPRCFEIERRLTETLDIPVFHDDQHGTAVVVLSGILNAVKLTKKSLSELQVVVNGAGAAALSVSQLLLRAGVKDIIICDTKGVIYQGRTDGMNHFKEQIAEITNLSGKTGTLSDVLHGVDVFIGLSVAGMLTQEMVRTMAAEPLIFALANPVPEIMPDEAYAAGAKVVATGRSDFPNQVNNSLAFPGIFRGALDVQASCINTEMKLAAADAIASLISDKELSQGKIIPGALDFRVPPAVAQAVAQAAIDTGVARKATPSKQVYQQLKSYIYEGTLERVPSL